MMVEFLSVAGLVVRIYILTYVCVGSDNTIGGGGVACLVRSELEINSVFVE